MAEIDTAIVRTILMLALVVLASASDLKTRKIPNRLTLPFALVGLAINTLADFPSGIVTGFLGLLVGFLIFLLPYTMKAMGAGDLKLMAALGAVTDWRTVLYVAVFTALAGGIMVIVTKVIGGGLRLTLKRTGRLFLFYFFGAATALTSHPTPLRCKEKYRISVSEKQQDYIPYALAIAAGCVITLILSRTGVLQGLSI